MTTHDGKLALSSTSAMVLLWAEPELYTSPFAQRYWDKLDLSAGLEMDSRIRKICSFNDDVIKNRKWIIRRWSNQILDQGEIKQVVIIAAGLSPQGLEIAENYPDVTVYELDLSNMTPKANLVDGMGGAPNNIHFITADLTDIKACSTALMDHGWKPDASTLLVAEGISYYLSHEDFVQCFSLVQQGSRAIIDYLVPCDQLMPERRELPGRIFEVVVQTCALKRPIETWRGEELVAALDAERIEQVTMCDIEKLKNANNPEHQIVFPTSDSGWIELINIGFA
jgi:O-methyltransferase involved in polyketide biosynthesis